MGEERPGCAGWHERGNPECDGTSSEAPSGLVCFWRQKCVAVQDLVGPGRQTRSATLKVLEETSDEDLEQHETSLKASEVARARLQAALPPPKAPVPTGGQQRADHEQSQHAVTLGPALGILRAQRHAAAMAPPYKRYGQSINVLANLVRDFARRIKVRWVGERDLSVSEGDLYLHFYRGGDGDRVSLYEYLGPKRKRHRLLSRFALHRDGSLTMKPNCQDIEKALGAEPPTGLGLKDWKGKDRVVCAGIRRNHLRAAAGWLERMLRDGLIGGGSKKR